MALARRHLLQIFQAAVTAVEPSNLVAAYLEKHPFGSGRPVPILGAGKAAARMAQGAEAALGKMAAGGQVIVADGCEVPLRTVDVCVGGHPVPDWRGAEATTALARRGSAVTDGPVLCLFGGGASSLLVQPAPSITLAEKMAVTRQLLACGADILEINTVRKHLSTVKGGGLLRLIRARPVLTLILSDVIGDDPSVVASGPTTADRSSFADALSVLDRYHIAESVPAAVCDRLQRGRCGLVRETLKADDPELNETAVAVVGSNRLALAAAADRARQLGYEAVVYGKALQGETRDVAQRWVADVAVRVAGRRACVIAGGETTVSVRGAGRGGRNQEFALAVAAALSRTPLALLSAGSDGVDGPTDAAGAFVDGRTAGRARKLGLDAEAALAANDSYTYFDRLDDLLRCGPTGTNVMDIKIAVGVPFGA